MCGPASYLSCDRRDACSTAWRRGSLIGCTRFSLFDVRTGEAAIYRGLEKRTADLKAEQERRAKAAAAADEEFSAEFLSAARKVFEMIDVDNSGTLTKQEIITAVKENKEVKMFLANCGNENLQYLLVPSRLNHALSVLDKDGDDEIDANEWCVLRSPRRWGAFDAATAC